MTHFRIYPRPAGSLYFDVKIYDTRAAMRRALKRTDRWLGVKGTWSRAEAVCRSFDTLRRQGRKWVRTKRIGVLFFHRQRIGAEIAAHEMAHAAVQWARRTGLSGRLVWRIREQWESGANELFARVVGTLNRQFWLGYDRRRKTTR